MGVRLQGLDPEYTLVLVDGQRVAGRAGPATDVSRFSLREVERVEIVKGERHFLKLAMGSYYNQAGTPARISFRYAQVAAPAVVP